MLASVAPPFGSIYLTTPASTSIVSSTTWTKAAGTTADVNLNEFTGTTGLGVNNRLRYDGRVPVHLHAVITFSINLDAGANVIMEAGTYFYDASAVSGSILAHSVVSCNLSSTAVQTGALHFDVMVDTNDYVEFHIRNMTNTADITIDNMYMFCMGMLH
jgi:hypothetical protein